MVFLFHLGLFAVFYLSMGDITLRLWNAWFPLNTYTKEEVKRTYWNSAYPVGSVPALDQLAACLPDPKAVYVLREDVDAILDRPWKCYISWPVMWVTGVGFWVVGVMKSFLTAAEERSIAEATSKVVMPMAVDEDLD